MTPQELTTWVADNVTDDWREAVWAACLDAADDAAGAVDMFARVLDRHPTEPGVAG